MMKKIVTIVLIATLALAVFTACGAKNDAAPEPTPLASELETPEPTISKPVIGLSLSSQSAFNQVFAAKFEALFADSEYHVMTVYADGDYDKQVSDLATMLSQDIRLLVLDPSDLDNLEYIISEYEVASIPVINLTESVNAYTKMLIGPFYRNMGTEIGQYAFGRLADITDYRYETNTVFLRGRVDSSKMQGIFDGFTEAADDARYNAVVGTPACNYDYDKTKAEMAKYLTEYPKIHFVFAETGEMALAAIDAIDEAGVKGVLIATVGADPETLAYVKDRRIDATIFYAPDDLARVTGIYAERILNEGANTLLPQFVEMNYEIITPSNVGNYLRDDTVYALGTKQTDIPADPEPTPPPSASDAADETDE